MNEKNNCSEKYSTAELGEKYPLNLECGAILDNYKIAYQTYGSLNKDRTNAVLVCHALTGDQFAADTHPITKKPGWWENIIGSGKIIDTDRFFVICSNVLGGCMGSTGPASTNPATGKPWAIDFPVITITDMVNAQEKLITHLGIEKLFCVIGGSMGGMQALEWAVKYPEKVHCCIPIATSYYLSAQNIAFNEVGRQAVMADPDWCEGKYLEKGKKPRQGLAVARMAAHITYLSEPALERKFGRKLQDRQNITYGFDADFQIESYLRHQGSTFVERFDANSYLYITRALDYFDMEKRNDGNLANAFVNTPVKFFVVSFSTDWLFPSSDSKKLVKALNATAANVSFLEIQSDKGHDAFLLDEKDFHNTLNGFISSSAKNYGI